MEAPIEQAKALADDNPFQSVICIELALSPPTTNPGIPVTSYESELIKSLGFHLDMEADDLFPSNVSYSYVKPRFQYSQYVHNSALAFVQVKPRAFLFVANRLLITSNSVKNAAATCDEIKKKLETVCGDVEFLREFYEKVAAEGFE